MFKKVFLFASLMAFVGFSANAQWLDLSNNNNRITVGFQLGEAGFGTDYAGFGWGVSVSVVGIYADFLLCSPEHIYDKHVNSSTPYDQEAFCINAGYQIPILPWLRIAPILGYSQTSYGYVDFSTVNIEVDSETSTDRIRHDYYPTEKFHDFNFGGGIFIQPIKYVEIYAVGTRRAIYGGISINLTSFSEDSDTLDD